MEEKLTESELLFHKGVDKFNSEMNILSLFHTVQKLKAGLSILVNDNPVIADEIRDLYFKNATLYVDKY